MKLNAAVRLRTPDDVSYEVYCRFVDATQRDANQLVAFGLPSILTSLWKQYKEAISKISEEFGIGVEDVVKAFKERSVFKFLKAVKFSLKTAVKAIHETVSLLHKGLAKAITELHRSGAFKHVETSAKAVDDILNKYPILKKLSGLAIAGFLIWMWLNMSFSGDAKSDFALDDVVLALAGNYSVYDLFASPVGIQGLIQLAAGVSGVSLFTYLNSNTFNFMLALFYTAAKRLKLNVKIPKLSALR